MEISILKALRSPAMNVQLYLIHCFPNLVNYGIPFLSVYDLLFYSAELILGSLAPIQKDVYCHCNRLNYTVNSSLHSREFWKWEEQKAETFFFLIIPHHSFYHPLDTQRPTAERQANGYLSQTNFNVCQSKGWSDQLPQPQSVAKEQIENINKADSLLKILDTWYWH